MFRRLGRQHHDTLKAKAPFERSFVARAAHVRGPNGEIIERFES